MDVLKLIRFLHSRLGQGALYSLAELAEKYFRIEVEGLENIPDRGPAMIYGNHSGYAGADAVMLLHIIYKHKGRSPALLAHKGYFEWVNAVRLVSESFGFREANYSNGLKLLKNGELVLIFPEGEAGNFKSSLKRYQLQRFHTGFVSMALETNAPLIPCAVIGAEESHLNLGSLNLSNSPLAKVLPGLKVPLPVNIFPLPSKWKIKFLKPVGLKGLTHKDAHDGRKMREAAGNLRDRLQFEIHEELRLRRSVFFETK